MNRMTVAFAVILVMVSGSAAGMTTMGANSQSNTAAETEIDSCTIIKSPGTYVLTENITNTSESQCIRVYADNVTIDGNGHEIDATVTGPDGPGRQAISAFDQQNLTVKDITLTDWSNGVYYAGGANGAIRNVTAARNSVGVGVLGVNGAIIADNTVRHNQGPEREGPLLSADGAGIVVTDSENVTVRDNVAVDNEDGIRTYDESNNITIVDNCIIETAAHADDGDGIVFRNYLSGARVLNNTVNGTHVNLRGSNFTIASNDVTDGDIFVDGGSKITVASNHVTDGGIFVDGGAKTIRDNVVTGGEIGIQVSSLSSGTVIDNRVTNSTTGLRIGRYSGSRIENNVFTGNTNGILIESGPCPNGKPVGNIHGNNLGDNDAYGILNEAEVTVNATNNNWGSPDGPSSQTEEPLEDPVTGGLADGNGTAVSEGPIDGVSNVHFDATNSTTTASG